MMVPYFSCQTLSVIFFVFNSFYMKNHFHKMKNIKFTHCVLQVNFNLKLQMLFFSKREPKIHVLNLRHLNSCFNFHIQIIPASTPVLLDNDIINNFPLSVLFTHIKEVLESCYFE